MNKSLWLAILLTVATGIASHAAPNSTSGICAIEIRLDLQASSDKYAGKGQASSRIQFADGNHYRGAGTVQISGKREFPWEELNFATTAVFENDQCNYGEYTIKAESGQLALFKADKKIGVLIWTKVGSGTINPASFLDGYRMVLTPNKRTGWACNGGNETPQLP